MFCFTVWCLISNITYYSLVLSFAYFLPPGFLTLNASLTLKLFSTNTSVHTQYTISCAVLFVTQIIDYHNHIFATTRCCSPLHHQPHSTTPLLPRAVSSLQHTASPSLSFPRPALYPHHNTHPPPYSSPHPPLEERRSSLLSAAPKILHKTLSGYVRG